MPIVEGAARFSEAEYLHFLDTAYGSAREVEYQVGLAFRLGLVPEQSHWELSALTVETNGFPCRWPKPLDRPVGMHGVLYDLA